MARLLTTGYETGDVAEAGGSSIGVSTTMTVVNSSPTPRSGGAYCLKIAPTGGTAQATGKTFTLPASKTELWVRFAVFFHPTTVSDEWLFAQVRDSVGSTQTSLGWGTVSNTVRLLRGTATLLMASTAVLPAEGWHVIDWRTQITSATVGISEVWLDGTRIINFSGDNTQTSTLNVQQFAVGTWSTLSLATGSYVAFDDIAINDVSGTVNNTRIGDGRVVLLSPSGSGSSTVLTRGGVDTAANWSQLDEVPPSMADYVFSATAGDRDLYALTDLGLTVQSINVVEAIALAQNSDAGAGSIAPTLKSGSTTSEATAVSLSTTAGYVTARWETDPNTSAAWTGAALDALEAGITIR